MIQSELDDCFVLLQALYDRWEPNQHQLRAFSKYMKTHKIRGVRWAINRLYEDENTTRKSPSLGKLRVLLRTLKVETVEKAQPLPNAWLICTEQDHNGRGYVGQIIELGLWRTPEVPMASSLYTQNAIAEVRRVYGGIWTPMCGPSTDVVQKRHELLKTKGQNAPSHIETMGRNAP